MTARWVLLLLILLGAIALDATEPKPKPEESYPGQAYYDLQGWHLEDCP